VAGEDQGERDVLQEVRCRSEGSEPGHHRRSALEPESSGGASTTRHRCASPGEEEAIADQEWGVERQLPPHRGLARRAPFGDDLLAARNAARGLEGDQRGAVVGHRPHRRQHRRSGQQRQRRKAPQPALGPGEDKQAGKWRLLHS